MRQGQRYVGTECNADRNDVLDVSVPIQVERGLFPGHVINAAFRSAPLSSARLGKSYVKLAGSLVQL